MTNDVKKVPELRFPEFSGEWEEKMLGDVLTILDGDRGKNYPSGSDFLEYGHTLFLNASNVTKNGFSFTLKQYITEKKSISMGNGKLVKNDVVLTTRGSIGNIGWYDEEIYRKIPYARINSGMLILRSNNKDMASFVSQFLMSTKGKRQIDRISFGSAQPQLTKKDIKLYRIDFPQIKEQQKIGDFFSKLDRQIELEEQKLAKLEEQKKGYMQKLFSQELRFKDQDGNDYPKWEKKFIKDIFIFENNRRKPITSSLREKGLYPYYGATGIIDYVKDYLFNNEERLLIGEDGAKWGQFENSSFIANGQYWVNNHAHVVKSNNHNLYFMNYYLNFKELRTFVTGNAPAKLTHENLCNINLEIPCLNEQGKISALLKSIDKKMNNQINKIVLLKRRKQGLLQKMFV